LNRLGLMRHQGGAAVRPFQMEPDMPIPEDWDSLPAIMQVNAAAAPFSAYRILSVLDPQFLIVELAAVRTILSQVSIDVTVVEQIAKRSKDEGIDLPDEILKRIGYVFSD
jgi:hypothetical protein